MSGEPGRIFTSRDYDIHTTLHCDVVIVGSGAGGSVLAERLTARGLDVVMLEEGGYWTRRSFDGREDHSYPRLYQEMANRATDDQSVVIYQGRSVGGGTTVNWCTCFRTPRRTLDHWRDHHGVKGLTEEVLTPHWEAIEKRLHIAEWPLERMNANNRVLWDGCGKLGYSRGLIRRNVNNCANLGYCGLGCPLDAKMSMLVTLIPDAIEKGMRLVANASVRRLLVGNRRVGGVEADLLDPETDRPTGWTLKVMAKTVVVSGGAINSPALLLRSNLDGNGNVGKRLFLHPVVIMSALMPEPVAGFSGAPQSAYSHHFIDRGAGKLGFFLEVPPIFPLMAATLFPGFGEPHQALLETLPYTQATIALCHDGLLPEDSGGTVKLRDPEERRVSIDYPLQPFHFEVFRAACKEMARIQFAAGAREVRSLHSKPVLIRKVGDIDAALDAAPWEPGRLTVATAHQMGGCAMGGDPRTSVVDSTLRYHGMENLFVVDGSVFPTSLGVNPQESIYGLARWASQFVAAATS